LGLRAQAECAQLAAVRRDQSAVDVARTRAGQLLALTRGAAAEAAAVTPEAAAWRALAEAEYTRLDDRSDPDRWRAAMAAWDGLARPYPAAYCRWRLVEALLAGSPRGAPTGPAAARGPAAVPGE